VFFVSGWDVQLDAGVSSRDRLPISFASRAFVSRPGRPTLEMGVSMNERVSQKPFVCLKACLKLAAASIAVLACGFHATDSQAAARAVLTFDDEFTSLSLWNGTSGTWDTNYWYNPLNGNGGSLPTNGEQEWYINSNYAQTASIVPWKVRNNVLTITGNPAPTSMQSLIDDYQYTSGELNSYHSFSQLYGYFEIRAKLPAGQGLWPAFWLLAENGSWPPEIDILEVLGSSPTTLYTSAHIEENGQEVNYGTATTVPDTSQAFHTYAVDWEPDTMTWYFDDKRVYQMPTPQSMDVPMFIETNLALGGNWPGDVNGTTPFPAKMEVRWIRVYSSKPEPRQIFVSTGISGQQIAR
jgi:beta-glucanase (GH16 family)